jgi:hypothetical protein
MLWVSLRQKMPKSPGDNIAIATQRAINFFMAT